MKDIAKVAYGKRKLGEEEFARQQAAKKGVVSPSGVVFGKRKLADATPTKAPAAPPVQEAGGSSDKQEETTETEPNPFLIQGDQNGDRKLSVAEVEKVLAEKPELFEKAFAAEFKDGKPRKGAAKLLLAIEKAQASPRPQILKVLEGHA